MRTRPLAAALAAVLLLPAPALAYWRSTGAGSATAGVATLSTPAVTVPASAGTSVPVSWTAAKTAPSVPSFDAQVSYAVQRSADGGTTWAAAAGTCAGALAASTTSCADAPPASGSYVYRVAATVHTWTATGTSTAVSVSTLSAPTLTAKPPSPSASAAPSFAFTGGGGTGYQCQLDGQGFAACTSPRAYASLSDGSHTFMVRATQGASTGTATTYTWTVATAAPAITASPANPTTQAGAAFAFSDSGFSAFACKLDGAAFAACNGGTATYGGLLPGSHTFTVHALDGAGVATADRTYTWTVNAAVTLTISSCKSTKAQGTTTANSGTLTVRIYAGSGTGGALAGTFTTTSFSGPSSPWGWNVAVSGLTNGATYTAQASQVDGAGRASTAPTCSFTA